jgi:hypothetical protein
MNPLLRQAQSRVLDRAKISFVVIRRHNARARHGYEDSGAEPLPNLNIFSLIAPIFEHVAFAFLVFLALAP